MGNLCSESEFPPCRAIGLKFPYRHLELASGTSTNGKLPRLITAGSSFPLVGYSFACWTSGRFRLGRGGGGVGGNLLSMIFFLVTKMSGRRCHFYSLP